MLRPCGTSAAYRRHRRYGEKACRDCLQAHARDTARRKKGGGIVPPTPETLAKLGKPIDIFGNVIPSQYA